MQNNELELIKKYYGERMMKYCKSKFTTILEEPGKLLKLLENSFERSKFLFEDLDRENKLDDFKKYIYSLTEETKEIREETDKSPFELMREAGYTLYKCENEAEVQSFKKYYKPGEELCTFNGNRLLRCHVFFAVRDDADTVQRENIPVRDKKDGYGTSVISIQFDRGNYNIISIKNRYNHTVDYPDATFSNNLDNIIPGLTTSFEKTYNLNLEVQRKMTFEIPGYVRAKDGKFHKYNYEINNIYYCPNNLIIDNGIFNYTYQNEKERYLVMDYFIIDLKKKTIFSYDSEIEDSFIDGLEKFDKIDIKNNPDKTKSLKIYLENGNIVSIILDKHNRMKSYTNSNLTTIEKRFLHYNKYLQELNLENVTEVDNYFLDLNKNLNSLSINNINKVGRNFLSNIKNIKELNLPNLEEASDFFCSSSNIESASFPKLKHVGDYFMARNQAIKELNLNSLESAGKCFLNQARSLEQISLNNIKQIDDDTLTFAHNLKNVSFNRLEIVKDRFLMFNDSLKDVYFPFLKNVGDGFLRQAPLVKFSAPVLEYAGNEFLSDCKHLQDVNLINLKEAKDSFLQSAEKLEIISLNNLEYLGDKALEFASSLKILIAPNLTKVGEQFLYFNRSLIDIDNRNQYAEYIDLSKLSKIDRLKVLKELYSNEKNLLLRYKQIKSSNAEIESIKRITRKNS